MKTCWTGFPYTCGAWIVLGKSLLSLLVCQQGHAAPTQGIAWPPDGTDDFSNKGTGDQDDRITPTFKLCSTGTEEAGICLLFSKCERDWDLPKQRPVMCGWTAPGGDEPVICCPQQNVKISPPTQGDDADDVIGDDQIEATDTIGDGLIADVISDKIDLAGPARIGLVDGSQPNATGSGKIGNKDDSATTADGLNLGPSTPHIENTQAAADSVSLDDSKVDSIGPIIRDKAGVSEHVKDSDSNPEVTEETTTVATIHDGLAVDESLPASTTSERAVVVAQNQDFSKAVPDFLACGCVHRSRGEACASRTLPDTEVVAFWPQVFGGEPVRTPGDFPWMALVGVRLGNETKWVCGGTLISQRHVLTAAHCIPANNRIDIVRLGEHDKSRTDDGAETADFAVGHVSVHPQYQRPVIYHDIAVLVLDREAELSDFIRPACLPPGVRLLEASPSQKLYIMGWGLQTSDPDAKASDLMTYAEVLRETNRDCNASYSGLTISMKRQYPLGITNRLICAFGLDGQDTCRGDSGGPLVRLDFNAHSKGSQYTVIGVVSTGKKGCGDSNLSGLYTAVEAYLDWIRQQLIAF